MKPTNLTSNLRRGVSATRQFPNTDYSFHAPIIHGSCGTCTSVPSQSFWRFSRDYFGAESQRNFVIEASVFALIAITAALPIIQNARAMSSLVSAFHIL